MLRRKIYSELMKWKETRPHKALLVEGQRQVGKTFIIRHFGKSEYKSFIEYNLSKDPDARMLFNGSLKAKDIIRKMSITLEDKELIPGETLIFLDEIQDCPNAWSALKDFTEDGSYDVIASGSLLGVELNISDKDGQNPLLPTGYQKVLRMKPLDFEEFLWAMNIKQVTIDEVIGKLSKHERMEASYHLRFTELFREYLVVGGMPEVVDTYVSEKKYDSCISILDDILTTCHRDMNRYNRGTDKTKTADCFDSIPAQLSQTNKKFMYSRIEGDSPRRSAQKYMGNLLWIKYAGLGLFSYNVTQPVMLLEGYRIPDAFKIFLPDTGLLMRMFGPTASVAVLRGDTKFNEGALAENLVATCLDHCGYPLYHYRKNSGEGKMELDFVIETGDKVLAIEVKSGKKRDAPSIGKVRRFFDVERLVLDEDQCHIDDDGIYHMPMYASAFMDRIFD